MSEVVELNVGGQCFSTLSSTLGRYPDSILGVMFSGGQVLVKDSQDRYFIDRPPKPFETILNFLRTGHLGWPQNEREIAQLKIELDYYGLSIYTQPPAKGFVLLVDDNKVNQLVVKKLLENLGYTVSISENGAEALDSYQKQSFDLIFMDCMMPIMDGIEATRTIRKIEKEKHLPRVPIVSITGLGFPRIENEFLAAGIDCHMIKPVSKEDLDLVLRKYVESQRSIVG
eukprot:TRINITY_DN6731_c0_g1_i2.p1 TRINITY_DN6731_c0_g1~~TRINITY_DN6731_c0_g1_i2.p1  ORF type:complete len:246 (+),score=41.35 TRINITY_DN6731_c0_g1_i2:56-739(+)